MPGEITQWRPNPKQLEFLNLPADIFEGFFAGSAGPGKSEILTLYPILKEFYKVPGFKGLIMRKTFPELKQEIILRAHQHYPLTGARYISDEKTYVWDAYNSRIRFGHLEHEEDKKKYDGAEYQYFAPDELTHFSWDEYAYIAMSRLRTTNRVRPIVRAASNPGGIGHEWVRDRFIGATRTAPTVNGRVIMINSEGLKRIYIPARLEDNEFLLKADPDYIKKLRSLPAAERKAKLDGDWWTFSGQVFSFREEPLEDEPEYARHVIDPFMIPSSWPAFLVTDVGLSAMNYSAWATVTPKKHVVVFREWESGQEDTKLWANEIGKMSYGLNVQRWALDHTMFEGTGETIASKAKRSSGLSCPVMKAEKGPGSRYKGLTLLQEYLHWDEKEDIRPKISITRDCPILIKTIPLCCYKEDKKRPGMMINDVEEFKGDDPYDAIRYLLELCDAHIKGIHYDVDSDHVAAKIENLARNEDWTSYYIQQELSAIRNRQNGRRYFSANSSWAN